MGTAEIIIYVVAALALGGVVWLLLRPKKALPTAEKKALEPEKEPAEDRDRPEPDAPSEEQKDEAPAEAPEAKPAEADEEKPEQPEAPAEADEEPPEAPDEKDDGEAPADKPKVPRFAPPPTFAPPPSLKKPKLTEKQPEPEKKPEPEPEPEKKPEPTPAPVPLPVEKPKVPTREDRERAEIETKQSERSRYREGLAKTKRGFISRLARLFKGRPKVSDDLKDEIEEVLFTADIGSKAAGLLLESVTEELDKKEVADPDAVWAVIRHTALEILDIEAPEPDYAPAHGPYTLLMIGVNGVGKTTTIGKLAARHVEAGRKTLMVAGDTFRAAAGEQLEVWARRVGCDIHMGKDGADPSSVLFDGITRGREQGYDVVLCDTAGRLHTKKELMDELGKMGRSAAKALSKGRDAVEPHDVFLVLDATIGQNALAQAQMFKETMGFTGLVLTKLDGTAKGGVVLGIVDELKVPIRYIGIGEAVDDLRSFDPEAFCDVLFKPDPDDANEGGDD